MLVAPFQPYGVFGWLTRDGLSRSAQNPPGEEAAQSNDSQAAETPGLEDSLAMAGPRASQIWSIFNGFHGRTEVLADLDPVPSDRNGISLKTFGTKG